MEFHLLLVAPTDGLLPRLASTLRAFGIHTYELSWRASVQEAIALMLDRPVDLLLFDLALAEAQGLDAVYRLAAIAPETAILPVDGKGGGAGAQEGLLGRALQRLCRARLDRRQLVHRATHDRLTGLANRWLLEEKLQDALARARRRRIAGGLLFVDLDGFKAVNDRWGHDAGDLVLEAVGRRLVAAVRASDTVARYGGDEFVVLLEEIRDEETLAAVAAKVERAVAEPIEMPDGPYLPSVSLGMALFPEHGEDLQLLIRRADRLLYRHKAALGRRSLPLAS